MRPIANWMWVLCIMLMVLGSNSVVSAQFTATKEDSTKPVLSTKESRNGVAASEAIDHSIDAIFFDNVYIAQYDSHQIEGPRSTLRFAAINLSGRESFVRIGLFNSFSDLIHMEDNQLYSGSRKAFLLSNFGFGSKLIGCPRDCDMREFPATFVVHSDQPLHLQGVVERSEAWIEDGQESRSYGTRNLTFTRIDCEAPGHEWVCSSWNQEVVDWNF